MIIDETYLRPEAGESLAHKQRYPRRQAILVASELVKELKPCCARIIVAGSLRRRKQEVGDVEILYIPAFVQGAKTDLFKSAHPVNAVDVRLAFLLDEKRTLRKRLSRDGRESWGPKNKLAVHVGSGIPVDLFSATEENWFNYLVCRTGSAANNIAICQAAERKGWAWHPYRSGFTIEKGESAGNIVPAHSEREVFEFAGLKYLEPWER